MFWSLEGCGGAGRTSLRSHGTPGATFGWWRSNKPVDKEGPYAGVPHDGNDPDYRDFYLDNGDITIPVAARSKRAKNTRNIELHAEQPGWPVVAL